MKIGDTEEVEKRTKADKEQSELEKKIWEEEKENTAARLKKLNEQVEQNGKDLKEALDNMPTAGALLLFEGIPNEFLTLAFLSVNPKRCGLFGLLDLRGGGRILPGLRKRSITPPNAFLEQQTESHMKAEVFS